MKTSDELKALFRALLFSGVIASVYCGMFTLVAGQFGLTKDQYAVPMGISTGILISIFNYLKWQTATAILEIVCVYTEKS